MKIMMGNISQLVEVQGHMLYYHFNLFPAHKILLSITSELNHKVLHWCKQFPNISY